MKERIKDYLTAKEISKEITRHEYAIRTLELIQIEQTAKENHQDTLRMAIRHGLSDLRESEKHHVEICEMVIERLTQRYESLCSRK